MAYSLLKNYANDTEVKGFVDSYDFYIFPFINPDGIAASLPDPMQMLTVTGFVHSQTTNRLWRKNRQRRTGSTCIGTDINRNWDAFWDVPGGASSDPCSETFKGKCPCLESKIES